MQAIPFAGEALSPNYVEPIGSQAYLGLAGSAMFCQLPFQVGPSVHEEMINPEYSCSADLLPFEYADWNPKWYQQVCRPWYQGQKEKPN